MQDASHIQTLSSWIWILFSVGLVTLITYIYSNGNWKTTTIFAFITAFIAIALSGIVSLNVYLNSHFIGQFDSLGLPYRKAGPGFSMFFEAWKIWLLPTFIISALVTGFFLLMDKNLFATEIPEVEPTLAPVPIKSTATNINQKIELEALKHEYAQTKLQLEHALETIKTQLQENQKLESKLEISNSSDTDKTNALEEQIQSLTIELESKNEMINKLESLCMDQEEKLVQKQT